jgi:hypothetical protein
MALSIFVTVHYTHSCVYDVKLYIISLYVFSDVLKGFLKSMLVTQSHICYTLAFKQSLPSGMELSD